MAHVAKGGFRDRLRRGATYLIFEDEFREVMRHLAAGVTIVTTKLNEEYFGLTVTAFSSVSLDPMLVQVSLDLRSRTQDVLHKTGFFCANILAEGQEEIARTFTIKGINRFDGIPVKEGETGAPIIEGAAAALECRVIDKVSAGDHTIFIGEALSGSHEERPPLIYYQGSYHRLAEEGS